jgi:hypothetical protein
MRAMRPDNNLMKIDAIVLEDIVKASVGGRVIYGGVWRSATERCTSTPSRAGRVGGTPARIRSLVTGGSRPAEIERRGRRRCGAALGEAGLCEPPAFVVCCEMPLSEARLGAVARLIEEAKPAQVNNRLRVGAPVRE